MGSLSGSVAVVSGASSGIGAAVAFRLATAGARVALVARRPDALAGVAARIPGGALRVPADLTVTGAAEAVVRRVIDECGRLDVLVNNAGEARVGPIVGADRGDWARMVELNLEATMALSWAALPHLLDAARGPRGVADLVSVASIAGRRVQAGAGVYAATKAAVLAFSESLRQEVTARHVRVGTILPGAVRTEAAVLASRRAGRDTPDAPAPYLDVDDIAGAVEFIVTRPARMAVNEMIVRPTEQES
ncbi:SDR family oxidoreductase [Dactylosporangium sp. AC04546]|uniref:SDR family oxidoreductase n=1 Tax=Dactylosporangium sp. AC04546 TaxID=2862460 RepID=UPI001EDFF37B|nr:SDR family oxidoreductase [Dactylosporangium sp. AC04546]WVK89738.1 SDR family oxidoreductase [Dactylosporangium sp. AC04546]